MRILGLFLDSPDGKSPQVLTMGTALQHTIDIIIHDHGLIITDDSIRKANATHIGGVPMPA